MILDHKVRIFLQVARVEGFRRAARGLGLSQSAVSFHIDKLEEELGVKLFNRQGRTISLTPEGLILFQELEELDRAARRVENNFAFHSNLLGRRVRIGSNAVACPFTLPWVIQAFKEEHPEVLFTYRHVGDEGDLISDLETGDLDLAILGHQIRHRKLDVHECYESDIVLAAAPSLWQEQVDADSLATLPIIFENSDRGLELILSQGLGSIGLDFKDLNIIIESDNLPLIKTFVLAGLGAAFLPQVTMMDELDSGKYREIRVNSLGLKQSIFLVHPKSGLANPSTARFVEFVETRAHEIMPGLA
jgi:DNA-binding transcriptional LysR family regulator